MEQPPFASLLRKFVEPIPSNDLNLESAHWTWEPEVKANFSLLSQCSPTQEYSTENGEN